MARTRVAVYVCAVFMALLLSCTVSHAQMAGTGLVGGTITDPSGAAVAGATVTLKDKATGKERVETTNESGRFTFSSVVPGRYDVTVVKPGFRQVKFSDQEVVVAESRTFDAKLDIGSATETVEVVASNTELQTMNATIGATVTGVPLDSLPSLGRDVSTFATLQPGVSPDGSVGGANQDQNSFFLDGGNNSSDMDGTQNTYTPSFAGDPTGGLVNNQVTATAPGGASGGGGPTGVLPTPADSVEEFRVVTSNQTADFNSSAGAQVQLVTKRGGNQWHGTGYEYYLNNNWNANSFDNNATGTSIPVYHYNRFGGSVGGPVIPKEIWGGKTYFFANYEGFRWGNSATVTRAVPSDGMKLGLLQFGGTVYNLNPGPVTYPTSAPAVGVLVPGTTYAGSGTTLDPRGLGISPTVQAMFQRYEPASNISSCGGVSRCDGLNVLAFRANYALPWKDNFGVARLDHDFGSKWHFYATYRYYKMERATSNQVDIGGFFNGDKLGKPVSTANRPQNPWYLTAALTTNITSNLTNDFHYSYLRNYWARASNAQPPQIAGLGGALEPFGESSRNVLAPYNLDTQDVRTRFWDGQDHMIRDDLSWAKGTHFFQFGGLYQHNWNYHQRTDNGGGINYQTVYWLGASVGSTNGMDMTGFVPAGISSANGSNWSRDYAIVLGVPGVTQIAYTRTGSNLTLNPPNTPAYDKSTIPFYNLYFNDSWRMKRSITLNYGLGWTLEMPPIEAQGKQIAVVDANNKIIDTAQYLQNRENAALAGQVYNPEIGFNLIGNVAGHPKYLYNPYYKSVSPRIAVAWNPSYDSGLLGDVFGRGKTVVRGGFSILYGRLNGVDLVLVPLLGTGLIQAVQCVSPLQNGNCGGPGGSTPNTAFRIGPTANGFNGLVAPLPAASQTLSQPDYPGVNEIAAGAGEGIDPNFRPSMSKQFDLTVQRQFTSKLSVEFGYMGRLLTHEFQPLNVNAVPYMMTVGGQRFDSAFGQMVWQYCGGAQGLAGGNCKGNLAAVTPQPFFESALNPAYCAGFASCTAAVASKEGNFGGKVSQSNIALDNVWSLWSDLDSGGFKFPRSMLNTPINCPTGAEIGCNGQLSSGIGMNTSFGYGNYNGAFISVKMNNWHGITLQSNFTYSKALGTGSQVQATSQYTISDPYYLGRNYGLQPWDRKYLFNTWIVYQPPFYQSQQGILGHLLGGWTFAPIIDLGSGLPLGVFPADAFANELYGGGQAFGEADAANFGALQNAINMCSSNSVFGSSRHNNPAGSSAFGSSWYGPSLFSNPEQAYSCFRNPILGIDNGHNGAAGQLRGLPFWNVDFSMRKNLKLTERFSTEFSATFTNLFNHNQMSDPLLILGDVGDWGGLGGATGVGQVNNPRAMEFGLRVRF